MIGNLEGAVTESRKRIYKSYTFKFHKEVLPALKKAGFNYFKVFLIVIGIGAFAFIVFVCCIFFIIYKIKHRNVKGNYVRHIEEDVNSVGKIKKMDIVSSRIPDK